MATKILFIIHFKATNNNENYAKIIWPFHCNCFVYVFLSYCYVFFSSTALHIIAAYILFSTVHKIYEENGFCVRFFLLLLFFIKHQETTITLSQTTFRWRTTKERHIECIFFFLSRRSYEYRLKSFCFGNSTTKGY